MTFKVKTRIKNSDCAAEAFALERHGKQKHGSLMIEEHLRDVVENVRKHYDPHVNTSDPEEVIAAAWMHDIMEDTSTDSDEIEAMFGERVAHIVGLLTDKQGYNRLERHLYTYHMIRTDNDALLIKLCDRRHNQARSLAHGEHWMAMYLKEYTYFKFALWTPHKFKHLWLELDSQYAQMQEKLSW